MNAALDSQLPAGCVVNNVWASGQSLEARAGQPLEVGRRTRADTV
jgi:hypothetical protein